MRELKIHSVKLGTGGEQVECDTPNVPTERRAYNLNLVTCKRCEHLTRHWTRNNADS